MNFDEEIMIGIVKNLKVEGLTLGRYTENNAVHIEGLGPRPLNDDVLFAAEFLLENSKHQIMLRWMKDGKIQISSVGELAGAMLSNPKLARLAARWAEKNPTRRPHPVIDSLTTDNLEEAIRDGLIKVSEWYAAKKMSPKTES